MRREDITDELLIAFADGELSEPQASAIYFKEFIKRYPNSEKADEAKRKLIESYVRLDQFEEALRHLDSWTNELNQEEAISWKTSILKSKENLLEKIDDKVENKQRKRTEIER
jgi:TolA-binding protein